MPFTPYHLGPGLCLGLPLRRVIHAPTFILANILPDIEPLLVLVFNLKYPLHGYLHSLLAAILMGGIFGYAMYVIEEFMQPLYKLLLLETSETLGSWSFTVAGSLGALLHVLLDTPLYSDIKPFYPLMVNPLYNPLLTSCIYTTCSLMLIIGLIYYTGLAVKTVFTR